VSHSKPKILIISHAMQIGGVERSLVGLLEALDPAKVEVHLFLYAHEGEFMPMIPSWVKLIPESPSYVALGLPLRQAIFSSRPWIGLARLWSKLVTNLGQKMTGQSGFFLSRSHKYAVPFLPKIPGEYDLAISFLMPHDIVWKNVTAQKKAGWIHTDYTSVETGVNLALETPAWAAMDKIVAVSDEVAKSFIKVFPVQAAKVEVIENLLSPSFVRRQSLIGYPPADVIKDPETLVLCSAGRYTHQKAFDLAALACRKLLDAGMKVRWYILGYGPDEPLLRKLISENKLEDSFILLGKRTNPYPYMKACDIYVQPSRYEGKAVAVREAQMLGKPVLISDFATAGSQLEHNIDGYIAEAGVDGLVRGIQYLGKNRQLRLRLADNANARNYGNLSEINKVYNLL
jgi:glycosyltransferase involved in cell wall biosynthesis